jgi:NADH-dependent peroxiredoxin subunit F
MKVYDVIIIGGGPASFGAAIYTVRKKLKTLVLAKDIGGQAIWSSNVENYPGFDTISGYELIKKFEDHAKKLEVEIKTGEEVASIEKKNTTFEIKIKEKEKEKEKTYEAKSVIICSGKRPRQLNVPGEREFLNKGVAYCATCDAPMFADRNVAVIGGGNSALDAVLQLINIAKKIYLVNSGPNLTGDPIMIEKAEKSKKVTIINDAQTVAIFGKEMVEQLEIKKKNAEKEEYLEVSGIFIEIGSIPNSEIANVEKNEFKEIKINSENETNIPGIFAAGDVTDISEKQIVIAAGEGAKAALSVFKYLSKQKD